MKQELRELIEQGKIVVGVYQNTDEDLNRTTKMNLRNIWKDEKTNISQLLGFLYSKTILKVSNISIRYQYNYNDVQEIKVIQKYKNYDDTITKTEYVFYNIPTNMGYLATDLIEMKLDR